ncbi:PorV/PorQ family protein [bacterium]|nr:PorV/PorQ family protein [bacterium]
MKLAIMFYRNIAYALLLLFLTVGTARADGDAGTQGPFSFGVDSRAIALGSAYTGVAEDASAVYWNPGGLGFLGQIEVASLYVPLYESTDYGFFSLVYPIQNFGVLGLGFMALNTVDIPKTDEFDNALGSFSDLQMQLLFSYANVWWKNIAAGVNLKLHYHRLDSFTGIGFGADLGIFYLADKFVPGLSLGLMATNAWRPQITLVSEPDVYPINFRLGSAYRLGLDKPGNHKLLLSVEVDKSEYTDFKLHAGLEYQIYQIGSLRGGWDQDHAVLGVGLTYLDGRLDYALSLQSDLGHLHLFTVGWRFGKSLTESALQQRQKILAELKHSMCREYYAAGLAYLKQNKYKRAMEEFEKALSWIEESPVISKNYNLAQKKWTHQEATKKYQEGHRYYDRKAYVDALLAWRETADLNPKYPGIKKNIAKVKARMKKQLARKPKKSKRPQKSRRSQINQRNQDLLNQGMAHYLDENYSLAIDKWQAALKLNPNQPLVKKYLDKVQSRKAPTKVLMDLTPTARQRIRREIDKKYKKGLLLYRKRDFTPALSQWRSVLEQDPDHVGARHGVERIEAILSAFEKHGLQ